MGIERILTKIRYWTAPTVSEQAAAKSELKAMDEENARKEEEKRKEKEAWDAEQKRKIERAVSFREDMEKGRLPAHLRGGAGAPIAASMTDEQIRLLKEKQKKDKLKWEK